MRNIARVSTMLWSAGLAGFTAAGFAIEVAPPPGSAYQTAYDPIRQEVVLYGVDQGHGFSSNRQTWVWNGKWHLKQPAQSPPAIFAGAMAFDEARGAVVSLGGSPSQNIITNGTWLWDGTNWSAAQPTHRPAARSVHSMAYDSIRGEVVLFGGDTYVTAPSPTGNTNDTWAWNGADWSLKSPADRPSVRSHCALAFDEARAEVILFGGNDNASGAGQFSDTWAWNGTNWTQRLPANSPPALNCNNAMVYDSVRQELVLFSGLPSSGVNNDTWTWNGTNWTLRSPAVRPASRVGHSLAFDHIRGKVVLFGGEGWTSQVPLADTWLWDGTNWFSSDMTLSLTAAPSNVLVGSNLIYSVVLTNKGPSVGEEVVLVHELPPSVALVSAAASQGSCSYADGKVTCELGLVPAGSSVTATVVVTPLAVGAITNVATVLCAAELNPSNNVAKAAIVAVSPPVVESPLANQTVGAGGQTVLSIGATGSQPLTYQWFDPTGTLIAQGTSSVALTNVNCANVGYYAVVVSNPWGSVTNTALVSMNDLRMYAGIRICGALGANYRVEARNSLSTNDLWLTLTNLALPSSPFLFIDEESPAYPYRFYRVTSP